jgi:hypothetical protein
MRKFMKVSLADMPYPEGQYEGLPPWAYGSPPQPEGPPAEETYGYPPQPPPVAYAFPPPPPPITNTVRTMWSRRDILCPRTILAWLSAALRLRLRPLGLRLPPLVSDVASHKVASHKKDIAHRTFAPFPTIERPRAVFVREVPELVRSP